uniref:Sushi domain-containing protein n=1 Tax=Anas platyrhynchos TaxID=8839 RepID=A0A8B9SU45_ANAPL
MVVPCPTSAPTPQLNPLLPHPGTCQKRLWDPRLRLAPEQELYKENAEVTLSCPEGFKPSFTHIRCAGGVQTAEHSGFVDRTTWLGRKSTGVWIPIEGPVECLETCRKPSWDPRLRLAPEQEEYKENEEVTLSCPEAFEPSFTHIKCSREDQPISTGKPVYREVWKGKGSGGAWTRIHSMVQCVGKRGARSSLGALSAGGCRGRCQRQWEAAPPPAQGSPCVPRGARAGRGLVAASVPEGPGRRGCGSQLGAVAGADPSCPHPLPGAVLQKLLHVMSHSSIPHRSVPGQGSPATSHALPCMASPCPASTFPSCWCRKMPEAPLGPQINLCPRHGILHRRCSGDGELP